MNCNFTKTSHNIRSKIFVVFFVVYDVIRHVLNLQYYVLGYWINSPKHHQSDCLFLHILYVSGCYLISRLLPIHSRLFKAEHFQRWTTRTSQVSVKVVHPLNLSLQFIPQCFLQSLPLGRAFH